MGRAGTHGHGGGAAGEEPDVCLLSVFLFLCLLLEWWFCLGASWVRLSYLLVVVRGPPVLAWEEPG